MWFGSAGCALTDNKYITINQKKQCHTPALCEEYFLTLQPKTQRRDMLRVCRCASGRTALRHGKAANGRSRRQRQASRHIHINITRYNRET